MQLILKSNMIVFAVFPECKVEFLLIRRYLNSYSIFTENDFVIKCFKIRFPVVMGNGFLINCFKICFPFSRKTVVQKDPRIVQHLLFKMFFIFEKRKTEFDTDFRFFRARKTNGPLIHALRLQFFSIWHLPPNIYCKH